MGLDRSSLSTEGVFNFTMKWTPRAIALGLGGYYGLGIAYEFGWMALLDKVMIQAIKHFAGYAGVGALMPYAQWYAAWGVRISIGIAASLVYDQAEKIASFCWSRLSCRFSTIPKTERVFEELSSKKRRDSPTAKERQGACPNWTDSSAHSVLKNRDCA